jgi:hypothetical protein
VLWARFGAGDAVDASYTITFPDYFDDNAPVIEAKGYFADLVVEAEGRRYRPLFYDTVRFRQEYEDHLSGGAAAFVEPNVVIVPVVTRGQIEAAVAELARAGFQGLEPEP